MTMHPDLLHALVTDRRAEMQRAADRHRLAAETRTRVSLWRRLTRSSETNARALERSEDAQTLLHALEKSLRGPIIAGAECHSAGERRCNLSPEATSQTRPHRAE
jgi:hypothetical protein